MKKSTLTFAIVFAVCAMGALANAGTEKYAGKEVMQQAPAPCEWYRANEWNFNVWGTIAFPGNDGDRDIAFRFGPVENGPDPDIPGTHEEFDNGRRSQDRFINRSNAWGGGADIKYFFNKYWALGAEGLVLDCDNNIGGGGFATVTLRYPIGCSRFAPYVFGGLGYIGGGSQTNRIFSETIFSDGSESEDFIERTVKNTHAWVTGQIGTGLEYRITRHVGAMADFAWNMPNESDNNFGMARFGVTLSY